MNFDIQASRQALKEAEKDYKNDGYYRAAKIIKREAEETINEIGQEYNDKVAKAREEVENLNPESYKNKYSSEEGYTPREIEEAKQAEQERLETFTSTVEMPDRTINAETVAVMDYLKKTVISRMEAEGRSSDRLNLILEEVANHPDKNMRYVLIDHLGEISKAAAEIGERQEFSVNVHPFYLDAKENVKTEKQKKYEEAERSYQEVESAAYSQFLVQQRNLQDFIGEIDTKLHALDDPDAPKDFLK